MSGVVKSDGQSLTFDSVKGKIGGGEVTASVDARPGANGIVLNARVEFSGVDGTALRYRNLAMPAGPRLDADDADEPGPQRLGADRRAVRQRNA